MLSSFFSFTPYFKCTSSLFSGSMLCVCLPSDLYSDISDLCYDHAEKVQNALYHDYNIEVGVVVLYLLMIKHCTKKPLSTR